VNGSQGLRLHYDGTGWKSTFDEVVSQYSAVWGTGFDDVYVLGRVPNQAAALHFDGNAWTNENGPTWFDASPVVSLDRIWGTGPDNIFAAGTAVVHYDGARWNRLMEPNSFGIHGWSNAKDRTLIVGDAGRITQYDGTTWRDMTSGTKESLGAVWGVGSADVFVVGNNATILHYSCDK
jgi:hypothetical protein